MDIIYPAILLLRVAIIKVVRTFCTVGWRASLKIKWKGKKTHFRDANHYSYSD